MDAATTIRLEVAPLLKHIGAEIRDLRDDLTPSVVVHRAMKSWSAVFPDPNCRSFQQCRTIRLMGRRFARHGLKKVG